jgi:2-polyprenyl-3-methyl-5-hydroxy-6-metoxy-1,4-benzoquinol methylase
MIDGQEQHIDDHIRQKYTGGTCGGESGILSPFHQLRIETAKDLIREHLWKRKTGAKVLDIGCNDGTVSAQFLQLGAEVHGIDLGEENVRRARGRGIEAQVCNARERLPYPDGAFDVVFVGELLEHLYDTEVFLKETHRVLRRGGAVVLTTPNLASLANRLRMLCGYYPKMMSPFLSEGMGDHIHLFTADTLELLLEKTGFSFVEITSSSICLNLGPGHSAPYLSLLASLLPSLGDFLVAKAEKVW